ncbi:MAG TPA: glycosyltransferase family 1 protein [Bryobacteraceae bacterium]|nr:glycosyltransferase family 1 protein [Bryobacteraceae bacterium]
MNIALDATYSVGRDLSGVGGYSREMLAGLPLAHPAAQFMFCYRPHRFLRSFRERLPANAGRFLLGEARAPRSADVFHGLHQRLPRTRLRHAVTTFHDLFVLTGEYSTPEFRRRFAEQAREAANRSERIIAVSQFTARQVTGLLGVEEERVRVIHHGVRLPVDAAIAREKVILHVGAIQHRKNIARLVDAFERVHSEWRLVLAGASGYGADSILAKIGAARSRERIRLLGYVTPAELAGWFARAMIFAFPSLDEGFGMPVLEAMAAGVPVIASNRSAVPEVAGDAAWLVDPENVEELSGALVELTRDAGRRAELSRRGLRRAAEFTWDEALEKTWRVYCELVEGYPD